MPEILSGVKLTKQFPGVLAVDRLSFSLNKGEVLAFLGENGAGKSTLTKMLCGALRPTRGQIFLEEKEVSFHSSHDAMNFGIAMVFQELAMTSGMSVAENIFMNRQPTNKIGLVKKSELYEMAKTYLDLFNIKIDPNVLVKRLVDGSAAVGGDFKSSVAQPESSDTRRTDQFSDGNRNTAVVRSDSKA